MAYLEKNPPAMWETWVQYLGWGDPLDKGMANHSSFVGFPLWLSLESTCSEGYLGSIPGLGRSPGEGKGYPLQYFGATLVSQMVKNSPAMYETWVQTLGWEDPLEKRMATHSSILSWRIPWTEGPGGLQSTG